MQVVGRERELDALQGEVQRLMVALEAQVASEREGASQDKLRLGREAARLEALQAALLAEREELRMAAALERRALEEARSQRAKVKIAPCLGGVAGSGAAQADIGGTAVLHAVPLQGGVGK